MVRWLERYLHFPNVSLMHDSYNLAFRRLWTGIYRYKYGLSLFCSSSLLRNGKNTLWQRCLESSCEIREEFDRNFYNPGLVSKSNCDVYHREVVRNFMDIPEFWRYSLVTTAFGMKHRLLTSDLRNFSFISAPLRAHLRFYSDRIYLFVNRLSNYPVLTIVLWKM